MLTASHATATRLIPSPIADTSIAGRTRRKTGRRSTRANGPTCDRRIPGFDETVIAPTLGGCGYGCFPNLLRSVRPSGDQ